MNSYTIRNSGHMAGNQLGGAELTIDGNKFAADRDSSELENFLFPKKPKWFVDAVREIKAIVKKYPHCGLQSNT